MKRYLSNMHKFLFTITLLVSHGCATIQSAPLPAGTRVLGVATIYQSATGKRLEIVHDNRADVAILKLPDGSVAVLPAEFVGSQERYKDARMTVWEHDSGIQLWIDGNVVFSGTIINENR